MYKIAKKPVPVSKPKVSYKEVRKAQLYKPINEWKVLSKRQLNFKNYKPKIIREVNVPELLCVEFEKENAILKDKQRINKMK